MDDIIEALESTCTMTSKKPDFSDSRAVVNKHEMLLWRNQLLKFLRELDTDLTVGEVVEALDGYNG